MNPSQENHLGAKLRARVGMGLVVLLTLPSSSAAQTAAKQLEVKLRQIAQKDCRGSDGAAVHLKLQLEITNVTQTKLIVSKKIGSAWYGITVAKDERALLDGSFESDWNIDWALTKSDLDNPPKNAPPAEFIILEPGKSFFADGAADLLVQADLSSPSSGYLAPGDHVLRLDLGTWFYVTPAEPFRDSWKKLGNLVYLPTQSNFLHFRVPTLTEFTSCRR